MIKNKISRLKNLSLSLFTDEEMNSRQDANRDEVLKVFSPLANEIVSKILSAGNCYLKYAEDHAIARCENTFCASNMHGLIIEHLSQVEGIRIAKNSNGKSFLEIGNYKVWVKKIDDNKRPWVNVTKASMKRLYQKVEGNDSLPMLILGYQMNELEIVTHIYLLYLKGEQHLWAPIDIGNIAASSQFLITTSPSDEEPIVTVKPEKKKGREAM